MGVLVEPWWIWRVGAEGRCVGYLSDRSKKREETAVTSSGVLDESHLGLWLWAHQIDRWEKPSQGHFQGAWKDSRRQQTEVSLTAKLQINVESCFQEGKWHPLQHILYEKKSNSQLIAFQFSCVWLLDTRWTAAFHACLSITNPHSLLKLRSIELVMPSNHLCHPLLLPPSILPNIRVFTNESALCISILIIIF